MRFRRNATRVLRCVEICRWLIGALSAIVPTAILPADLRRTGPRVGLEFGAAAAALVRRAASRRKAGTPMTRRAA